MLNFAPENWHEEQRRYDAARTLRDIVLKGRQVGFSTLELARDLWFALRFAGAGVLVIVHDPDLAKQLFVTLKLFETQLKDDGLMPATRYSNSREIVLAKTGSSVRIVESGATEMSAQKKGRSGTIHRLHATELAFWGAAGETMAAVLASVPATGEVVIESTPNGAGGLFYEDVQAARSGRNGYKLHFFAWWEHAEYKREVGPDFDPAPRDQYEVKLRSFGCSDEQIAYWRNKVDDPKIGLEKTLQEFPIDPDTCFRASGSAWIDSSAIDAIAPAVREPVRLSPVVWTRGGPRRTFGAALIYTEPVPRRKYVVGGDVAEGIFKDGSSITVLDAASGATVATWWSDSIEPGDFGTVMAVLGYTYNTAHVGPEREGPGRATLERLKSLNYPRLYTAADKRPGWTTNGATRPVLFDELGQAIREGSATTPDAETLGECRTIIRDTDGKPRARGKGTIDGCKDDRFVSWAIAWQMRSKISVWSTNSFNLKGF